MAQYRLLEIEFSSGEKIWRIEKKILGLWWSEYFTDSSEWGSTYYDRKNALDAYNYYAYPEKRQTIKVIAQNK